MRVQVELEIICNPVRASNSLVQRSTFFKMLQLFATVSKFSTANHNVFVSEGYCYCYYLR